ncbi:hypothetical protein [Salinirubrum litoreum]|uniref:DUF3068 domain-containing protein n=1 Tax=Salinirubrum litoreum TaxID=1126234 RepID=A0ABD5R7V9_9EURY|nr:hypothetical protein [Salinirubrum litoreum]
MTNRRKALALLFVGLLLVSLPVVVPAVVDVHPEPEYPGVVSADVVDPTDPDDQRTVIRSNGEGIVLDVSDLRNERESRPIPVDAPNETTETLRNATVRNVTTNDETVAGDLRRIDTEYEFYTGGDERRWYRLTVTETENGTAVFGRAVDGEDVTRHVIDERTVPASSLTAAERRTLDRVIDGGDGSYDGYRPDADDPLLDDVPALVERDGTVYWVRTTVHIDDFGPSPAQLVLLLAGGVGVVLLLASVAVAVTDLRADR